MDVQVRSAMQAWADHISQIVGVIPSEPVVGADPANSPDREGVTSAGRA